MASSSMCGPANPLQQLKNHTSFDRSVQQDRFRSSTGAPPSSQFRHQQPSQSLDHEFEQFLGTPPGPSLQHQKPLNSQRSIPNFAPASPALQQAAWAADFQRLQLNTPPPPVQVQQRPSAGLSGWGAEFMQQMNAPASSSSPALQQQQQQNGMLSGAGYSSMNSGYMGMGMSSYSSGIQAGPSTYQQTADGNISYSDAEFDQMFEEAATQQFGQQEKIDFPQREAPKPMQEARSQIEEVRPLQPLDEVEQTQEEKEKEKDQNDADELAKTAGQLLDTLSQDTSQKFQESQFVALMRKLRDKTVKVEDGKMVEVQEAKTPAKGEENIERGDADAGRHGFAWPDTYDSGCRMVYH